MALLGSLFSGRIEQAKAWTREFLEEVPEIADELREARIKIGIVDRPGKELTELGVDPKLRGVYLEGEPPDPFDEEAETDEDGLPIGTPGRIFLFTANHGTFSKAEICRTLAHELAHAIGSDEEEILAMGLG